MRKILLLLALAVSANAATPSAAQAAYLKLGCGAFFHWNMETFTPNGTYKGIPGWAAPNLDPNTFAPTVNIATLTANMDAWIQAVASAGCGYAILTARHIDGFALWPTAYHVTGFAPYSIAQTGWYAANGNPDIVAIFVSLCRKYHIQPAIYYCLTDYTFETRNPNCSTVGPSCYADYLTMVEAQLTELLSNYGALMAIWMDGWGAGAPYFPGVTNVPFSTIYPFFKALQPNALMIHNKGDEVACDPVKTCGAAGSSWDGSVAAYSDIAVYELPAGHVFPGGNVAPAEGTETAIWNDAYWFWNSGAYCGAGVGGAPGTGYRASCVRSSRWLYGQIALLNGRNGNYLLDFHANNAGVLPPEEIAAFRDVAGHRLYPTNLAAGKTVTASSQFPGTGAASTGTNGVLNTNVATELLHTNQGDTAPSFEVDLGSDTLIGRVEILNRSEVTSSAGRLRDVTVTIRNNAGTTVYTSATINAGNNGWGTYPGYAGDYFEGPNELIVKVPSKTGRYVKVARTPTNTATSDGDLLCVAEIEIFAPTGIYLMPSPLAH